MLGVREPFKYPAICLAIALLQPLLDVVVHNVIGERLSGLDALAHHLSDLLALLDLGPENVLGRNMDEAKHIGNYLGLGVLSGSRRAHDDDLWRSTGRVVLESQLQHSNNLHCSFTLGLEVGIVLEDELSEDILDSSEVQLVLLQASHSSILELRTV